MLLKATRRCALSVLFAVGLTFACGEVEEAAPTVETSLANEPAAERDSSPPVGDVILIVIDTLRAEALGAFDGTDRGTPVLDQLAREGVFFDAATSVSSYTRE